LIQIDLIIINQPRPDRVRLPTNSRISTESFLFSVYKPQLWVRCRRSRRGRRRSSRSTASFASTSSTWRTESRWYCHAGTRTCATGAPSASADAWSAESRCSCRSRRRPLPPLRGRHQQPVLQVLELPEELEDGTRPFPYLLRRQEEEEARQVIIITTSTAAITFLITPAAILTLRRQW
jgi:hypothetical protein